MIVRYSHRSPFLPNLFLGLLVMHELSPDSPLERSEYPEALVPGVPFSLPPVNNNSCPPLHDNDRKILPLLTLTA